MLKYSLLSESLFQVDLSGKQVLLSLPEVLSRLAAREDLSFTHLRPHQRAPWHAFLVQLAYLALEGDDDPALPDTADAWARCLRDLTSGHDDDAPWCLINSDWQRPAFLQPACSPGSEADYKRSAESAQDIDVLVTSRHHDEKTGKLPLDAGTLDALVYALITLQGWSSFLGAGNYNSMRMNGGFSSRPQFRVAFERGTGAEFCRDVSVLLETRDELDEAMAVQGVGSGREVPHALLWLLPWNGGSLPLADVHPLCLEVCRRVRMVEDDGRLMLRRAGSSTMRIAAKDARGAVLDPWVPLIKGDPNSQVSLC